MELEMKHYVLTVNRKETVHNTWSQQAYVLGYLDYL